MLHMVLQEMKCIGSKRSEGFYFLSILYICVCALLSGCWQAVKAHNNAEVHGNKGALLQSESLAVWPELDVPLAGDKDLEAKVSEVLSNLSVEQKVAQMIQPDIRWISIEDMRRYGFGSYQTGGDAYPNNNKYAPQSEWIALADDLYQASIDDSLDGASIPTLWASDAVHGLNNVIGATIFPHNIGLGATHNPDLIRRIGEATAIEVRTRGIDMSFAPTLAVARDDRWGRTYESYSENPALIRQYAGHMVTGLQGQTGDRDFLKGDHVIATAKHFVGDGGTQDGIDQGDTLVDEETLFKIHAQGYISAIESGVQAIMMSFNSWQGNKLHGHRYLLTDILKNRMGFDGMVIGDWNGHGQIPGCSNTSCAAAVNAGLDVFLVPEDWKKLYENTVEQVKAGIIPESRINDAVTRILRVKMRAGLFDNKRPSERPHANSPELLGHANHRDVAIQAVRESLVLLKNDNNILPLSPSQRILVAGNAADNIGQQCGGWTITWQGNKNINKDFPGATSILQGIKEAVEPNGGKVEYNVKGDFTDRPDVAVVVFGETPYAEGVGDITQLEYQYPEKSDLALLKKLRNQNIPTVAIFITGRPLWVNKELNQSNAFVVAWLPGSEGQGIADVIFKTPDNKIHYDFVGKLPFSWPGEVNQLTLNVGDKDYSPLFPFGFGLRYKQASSEVTATVNFPLHERGSDTENNASSLVLFKRVFADQWEPVLRLADESDTLVLSTIDKDVQADANVLRWNTKLPATFSLEKPTLQNISRYMPNGVLRLNVKVIRQPNNPVNIALGCAKDCPTHVGVESKPASSRPHVDIAPKLISYGDSWRPLTIDLKCFAILGEPYISVSQGFSITTRGDFSFGFSDIQLTSVGSDTADITCPGSVD